MSMGVRERLQSSEVMRRHERNVLVVLEKNVGC